MRAAFKFTIDPFGFLLRIILRIGEEVVQLTPAEGFHHAVVTPALGAVEVVENLDRQLLDAAIIHGGGLVSHVLALAPVGQRVGVVEAGGPFPALAMIQIGDHRPVIVIGQCRQDFNKVRHGLRGCLHLPAGLVDDCPETLLAAQLEDVLKLGVHWLALCLGQRQPGVKQRIRLGILHGLEVQIAEQPLVREVTRQQGIGYLPEEIPDGVVPGHASLLNGFVLYPLDYMGCCSTVQYIHSSPPEPRGDNSHCQDHHADLSHRTGTERGAAHGGGARVSFHRQYGGGADHGLLRA